MKYVNLLLILFSVTTMACSGGSQLSTSADPENTVTDAETSLPQSGDNTDSVLTPGGNENNQNNNNNNEIAGADGDPSGPNDGSDTANTTETAGLSAAETMAIIQRVLN